MQEPHTPIPPALQGATCRLVTDNYSKECQNVIMTLLPCVQVCNSIQPNPPTHLCPAPSILAKARSSIPILLCFLPTEISLIKPQAQSMLEDPYAMLLALHLPTGGGKQPWAISGTWFQPHTPCRAGHSREALLPQPLQSIPHLEQAAAQPGDGICISAAPEHSTLP